MTLPILTVIAKPAVDKTAIIPDFRLGEIHRPQELIVLPGGKGLNVARAARTLGADVFACLLLAGHAGEWMMETLAKEGIPSAAAFSPGETRAAFSVIDSLNGRVTEVYENGPIVPPAAWQAFEDLVVDHAAGCGWVCLSGSLPFGAPPDGYAHMIARFGTKPVLLDIYGPGAPQAIACRPLVVKINQAEAASTTGLPAAAPAQALDAARRLCQMGAQSAVVTLGKTGAVGVDFSGQAFGWKAPLVAAVSAVGSGDAFLAGIAVGLQRGLSLPDCARLGAAAGAANTLAPGAGRFQRHDAERLFNEIEEFLL
jgi:tagatose 6-phosphate kinase